MTDEKEKRQTVARTTIDGYTEIIDAMDFFCLTEEDIQIINEVLYDAGEMKYCPSCKKIGGHASICKLVIAKEIIKELMNQRN